MYLSYNLEYRVGVLDISSLCIVTIAFQFTLDEILRTNASKPSFQYFRSHIDDLSCAARKIHPTQTALNHAWVHVGLYYRNGVLQTHFMYPQVSFYARATFLNIELKLPFKTAHCLVFGILKAHRKQCTTTPLVDIRTCKVYMYCIYSISIQYTYTSVQYIYLFIIQ